MHAIGEASRRSGVGIETIRYYERAGIVGRPGRSPAGRRLYSDAEIGRLRFVRKGRDLGFPIADVRALVALAGGGGVSCTIAAGIGAAHLLAVRQKIDELERLRGALEGLIESCGSDHNTCPLLAALVAG